MHAATQDRTFSQQLIRGPITAVKQTDNGATLMWHTVRNSLTNSFLELITQV